MNEEDRERCRAMRSRVQELSREENAFDEEKVRHLIVRVVEEEHHRSFLPLHRRLAMAQRVFNSLCRLDVLQPLMEDDDVTDIMVNGAFAVFYEKNGQRKRYEETIESEERLEDLIQRIVGSVNRTVNEANPIVDARLPDGSRVNVVLPPVALHGAVLTIRKFRRDPIRMEDLIRWGTIRKKQAEFLQNAVKNRKNIFVCGGTASGKTTLLNILSSYIDRKERVITIEDSAELRLQGLVNVVSLETRNANVEGKGAVTMRDLIKTSLRMNPDYIIVGEVRGAEALDMLSGLNTGHAGMSTGHANSCEDMLRRIETMVWMGADIPLEAIRQQIASAIDLLVFVEKQKNGERKVTQIAKVKGYEKGEVVLEMIYEWRQSEECKT